MKKRKQHPKSLNTTELHPGGINSRARCPNLRNFKYYGDNFIYQNVLIPEGVSVSDVIKAMVEDIMLILSDVIKVIKN